jgi:hypothetical protein
VLLQSVLRGPGPPGTLRINPESAKSADNEKAADRAGLILSSRGLGYCDAQQHRGQHDAPEYPAGSRDPVRRPFGKKAPPARSSHMSLITSVALSPHHRRRGPPQPGERPAARVCVVGKPEKRQHSHQSGSHLENPGSICLLSFAVFIA